MKIYKSFFLIGITSIFLVACGVPGWGFSNASDYVQSEIVGLKVIKVDFENTRVAGNLTLTMGSWSGKKSFYLSEKTSLGWRYFFVFRESADCRYSIFVDSTGLVKSWRDEGGQTHMTRCYLG